MDGPFEIQGVTPVPLLPSLTTQELLAFHEKWAGVSYAMLRPAAWVAMVCTVPLIALRILMIQGCKAPLVEKFRETEDDLNRDVAHKLSAIVQELASDHLQKHGFVPGAIRLSPHHLRQAREAAHSTIEDDMAALTTEVRDWLMDSQAELAPLMDASRDMRAPPVASQTLSFPG